jgi:tetratricopeptide (TPR) repeat protein
VIVWGNYNQDDIQLSVEIGVTDAFPLIQIDRATLERTADVRVRMRDEHNESAVAPVLSVLNVLHTADGNGYEVTRILAIMDALEVTHAEIVSGGVAGHLQRAALVYVEDTEQAIAQYTGAINLQGGNPIPYCFRSAGYLRLGQYDKALRDIETARRLGPKDWTTPLYMEGVHATIVNDFDGALAILNQIVEQRPEDWFAINYRGALYYLRGDYEQAKATGSAYRTGPARISPT